jgi:hypothetical protein
LRKFELVHPDKRAKSKSYVHSGLVCLKACNIFTSQAELGILPIIFTLFVLTDRMLTLDAFFPSMYLCIPIIDVQSREFDTRKTGKAKRDAYLAYLNSGAARAVFNDSSENGSGATGDDEKKSLATHKVDKSSKGKHIDEKKKKKKKKVPTTI